MASSKLFFFLCLSAFVIGLCAAAAVAPEKKTVGVYELKRGNFVVKVSNFGATILSVVVPDSKGNLADVALGYDTIAPYVVHFPFVNSTNYFGALVGRVANRIGDSKFTFNGKTYHLYPNDGKNSLHGGHRGFGQVIWSVKERVECDDTPSIMFYYRSFDGEQGFPGELDVYVTYKITRDYQLTVEMTAKPLNKPTPVNLAQHSYWNLAGEGSGDILSNTVQLFASHITPVTKDLIPTGEIKAVAGTPWDFRQPATVGSRISLVPGGYDMNYVLDSEIECDGLRKVAIVKDCRSGRMLTLRANQQGVQFYTSNMLRNAKGKSGHVYQKYDALALETQGFPNSVNLPDFPSQIVYPGETYKHVMEYNFSF